MINGKSFKFCSFKTNMATTVAEVHLVRCPKCLNLLPEIADVPMYRCGGCGAILRARIRNASNQNVSLPATNPSQNLSHNESSTNGNTSSEKKIIHSSSESTQVEQSTSQILCVASSNAESCCYEKGEPSNAGASDFQETKPYNAGASDISNDAKWSSKIKSEVSFEEEAVKSPKLKEKGYDSSRKHDRLKASPESCSQCVDSEESFDLEHGGLQANNLISSTVSSSGDGAENCFHDQLIKGSPEDLGQSVASEEEMLNRTHGVIQSNNLSSSTVTSSDDGSENCIRDKYRLLSRRTVRDQRFSGSFGTKAKEGGELSLNNTKKTHRGMSLDSEAFYAVRNWVDSEKDRSSRSLSGGSAFFEDSAKNQIGSTELQDRLGRSNQRSRFGSAENMFFNHYPRSYQRPQQYQSSQMPPYNFCNHSLKARHPLQHANFSFPCSHNKTTKSYCRPAAGGAPFVTCKKCFEVLHMPIHFRISVSRLNKLKCGACSEVMVLSFPALAHEVSQSSNENGNSTALGATLHQLMGYPSARDLLFENW